jgi:hypothetical protein
MHAQNQASPWSNWNTWMELDMLLCCLNCSSLFLFLSLCFFYSLRLVFIFSCLLICQTWISIALFSVHLSIQFSLSLYKVIHLIFGWFCLEGEDLALVLRFWGKILAYTWNQHGGGSWRHSWTLWATCCCIKLILQSKYITRVHFLLFCFNLP